MSKNLNISVLVAARDEYIEQLKCIVTPLMIQGFNSIYQDSLTLSNGKRVIYKFQELLKEIPRWNQTILQEESKRIKKKCPYIMDIVTAIFVSNVKILASIRLKGKNENIRVKIPTSDIFIHSIYIESAQQFFYNPFLFYHRTSEFGNIQTNKHHVKEIIRDSVDETIRQMLPFDNILQEYLANALDDNIENVSDSEPSENGSFSDEESLNGKNIVKDNIEEPESFFDKESDDEHDNEHDDPGEVKQINFPSKGSNLPPVYPPQPPLPPPPQNYQQQQNYPPPPPPQHLPFVKDQNDSQSNSSSDGSDISDGSDGIEEPENPEERRREIYQERHGHHKKHHGHHHQQQSSPQVSQKYSFFD